MEFIETSIYCWSAQQVYMLFAFDKSEQDDLTREQLRVLRAYVNEGVL